MKSTALKASRNTWLAMMGAGISLVALYFVGAQLNGDLFAEALRTARYGYVLPCVVFLLAGLVTRALRWQTLLQGALPLRRAFSIMNVAYLVNGILPLRIGEVARMYLATRVSPPVPALRSAGSIIIERLLDLLAVVVMTLLALTTGSVPREIQMAAGLSAVVAVVGFGLLLVFAANRRLLHGLMGGLAQHFRLLQRLHLEQRLDDFLDGLLPITQPRRLAQVLLWTVLSWTFSIIAGYWLMYAFFDRGDLAATMLYIAAAAFAIALPAVPGSVGTYEASILLALVALGYENNSTAVAFAVMVHAVNVFVHASTGILGFIQEGISLGQLRSGVQQMRTVSTGQDRA